MAQVRGCPGISRRDLLFYSSGSIGEAVGYNVFISFFIYFATTVAGLPPVVAGSLSSIGLIWDAASDPIIGYLSDHSRSRRGRRRGYIRTGSLALLVSMTLLFWDWPQLALREKIIYFTLLNVVFWLSYTITDLPYLSLGGELVKSYEGRPILRSAAYTGCNIGYIIGGSLVLPMTALFTALTGSARSGWRLGGFVLAAVTALSYLVSYWGSRRHDRPVPGRQHHSVPSIAGQFAMILRKNRSIVLLCGLAFFVNIAIGIYLSQKLYLFTYCLGLPASVITWVMLLGNIIAIFISPFIGLLAVRCGKKRVMATGLVIYAVGMLLPKLLPAGFSSVAAAILIDQLLHVGNSIFFSLVYTLAYDAGEVNRFHFGEDYAGTNIALVGVFFKVGTALGMQISGVGLQLFGFDGAAPVQVQRALDGISFLFSWVSGGAVLIGLLFFLFYPLDRAGFLRIRGEIGKKESGLDYDAGAADGY